MKSFTVEVSFTQCDLNTPGGGRRSFSGSDSGGSADADVMTG